MFFVHGVAELTLPLRVSAEPHEAAPGRDGAGGHLLGDQWMPAAFSRWVTNVLAALLYFWV